MLLDSASLYFRAYFGVPDSVRAPDGTPVNAVRGFLDMVATLVDRFRPPRLVACLDEEWRPAWRVKLMPSYKAHRLVDGSTTVEATPEPLERQVPILLSVLAALGVATAGAPDHEADDVLGTLVTRERGPADVVSGDRDLFQLVDDDAGVRVLYTGRGVANLEIVDAAVLRKKYGIEPSQYADFATLRGDPSDGLPGVAGIGEKTAAGLLGRFGDLDGLLAAVDRRDRRVSPALWKRLDAGRDYLAVAPTVVRVARDAPVPTVRDATPREPAHPRKLATLAEQWGLESSVGRITAALAKLTR
jgi:5'-3' exonuclease